MVRVFGRFRRDERGVSLIEGLIVFPIVLVMLVSFVEFGYAVFQWNQTGRAVALGARLAAVSDPVTTDYNDLASDYAGTGTIDAGDPVAPTVIRTSCTGANPTGTLALCNAGIDRIITGSDGVCDADYGTGVAGMCDVNPWIDPENVTVTYTRQGLGYVGRVSGPVVQVTVALRDMRFQFFFLGALLGLDSIRIPSSPVTVTGEDMASCATPTRTAVDFDEPCP